MEGEERTAAIYLSIGSPELVVLEDSANSNSGSQSSARRSANSVGVTMVRMVHNNTSKGSKRTEQWKRLYRERWNNEGNDLLQSDTFRKFARVIQNRGRLPITSTQMGSRRRDEQNVDGSSRNAMDHFIQPGMSLEDRVKARAAHSASQMLGGLGKYSSEQRKGQRFSGRLQNLVRFADAVRLYSKHCSSRSMAFDCVNGREEKTVSPPIVLSLRELRRYLSSSSSGGGMITAPFSSNAVHAAAATTWKNTEKRAVIDKVERLCELVPEWIMLVDSDRRNKKRKTMDGDDADYDIKTKYSKNAVIVLRQDVEYCMVRDTILASDGDKIGSRSTATMRRDNLLLGRRKRGDAEGSGSGGGKVMRREEKNRVNIVLREDQLDSGTSSTVEGSSNKIGGTSSIGKKRDMVMEQGNSVAASDNDSDSGFLTQEEDVSSDTRGGTAKKSNEEDGKASFPARCDTPQHQIETKIKSNSDDTNQEDNSYVSDSVVQNSLNSSPPPLTSTTVIADKKVSEKLSSPKTTKQQQSKLKLSMTQRKIEEHHSSKLPHVVLPNSSSKDLHIPSNSGSSTGSSPSSKIATGSLLPSMSLETDSPKPIEPYIPMNKRSPVQNDKYKNSNDDDFPQLVVADESDENKQGLTTTPESCQKAKRRLRVNHNLHLTDADMNGGILIETNGTDAFPRGLKKLFTLLNAGKRI